MTQNKAKELLFEYFIGMTEAIFNDFIKTEDNITNNTEYKEGTNGTYTIGKDGKKTEINSNIPNILDKNSTQIIQYKITFDKSLGNLIDNIAKLLEYNRNCSKGECKL